MRLTLAERTMYEVFMQTFTFCMACGINPKKQIDKFFPVRWLENAHILGGSSRTADRRNILRLCKLCHDLAHGHTIRDQNKEPLPNLSRANLLWLKHARDSEHFDLDYLNSISIGNMPTPEEPPAWFMSEFERWQPDLYRNQTVEQFRGER